MKIIKGPSIEELISKAYIGLGSASFIRVDEVRFFHPCFYWSVKMMISYINFVFTKDSIPIGSKKSLSYARWKVFFMDVFWKIWSSHQMMQCIISVYFPLIPEQIFGSGSHWQKNMNILINAIWMHCLEMVLGGKNREQSDLWNGWFIFGEKFVLYNDASFL